jgi:hypothetical protein
MEMYAVFDSLEHLPKSRSIFVGTDLAVNFECTALENPLLQKNVPSWHPTSHSLA